MSEQWRGIPGWSDSYEVSNLGRVRSVDRYVLCRAGKYRLVKGRILKQTKGHRYLRVTLSFKNKVQVINAHRLVLLAFVGRCPKGLEALHGRRGPDVNSLSNLRYGTHSDNEREKILDGTSKARPIRRSDGRKFSSMAEAAADSKTRSSTIWEVCNGRKKTAGGFGWEYL